VSGDAASLAADWTKVDDYGGAVAYLETLRLSVIRPGLERIAWLCAQLGDPQDHAPVLHVTGTNGKGSTSRLAAAVLSATGLRTGLYTSPHLEVLRERIAIADELISESTFTALTRAIAPLLATVSADLETPPTHFEVLTALAFRAFADADVDALVLEVGLGGRFDATNVANAKVAVITNVELDHTEFLGPTRAHIAREKSGIIKSGAVVVTGDLDATATAIVDERCAEVGATHWRLGTELVLTENVPVDAGRRVTIETPHGRYADLLVPFHGAHQGRNAACALAAVDAFLDGAPPQDLVARAFSGVVNPGRFEIIEADPTVVIDVAHNPHGIEALIETLDERFAARPRVVVIGINPHKDAEPMLAQLVPGTRALISTQVFDGPAIPADELAAIARRAGHQVVVAVPDAQEAIERALDLAEADDVVVCTGSHYWIGLVRSALLARAAGVGRRRGAVGGAR
jgi:dihydrofolate synthase/folylpolyglutamate synthase